MQNSYISSHFMYMLKKSIPIVTAYKDALEVSCNFFLATREDSSVRPRSASSSSKMRLIRSHRYPYTSQLSRTLRKNYHDGDKKIVYLPVGSGEVVRNIGDQTSFNVHLNKDQVNTLFLLCLLPIQNEANLVLSDQSYKKI